MTPPRRALRLPDALSAPWMRLWAGDSAVLVMSQAATVIATGAMAVIVARYLGPAEFGIFSGALGLTQVLMLLSSVGAATWLLRELSRELAAGRSDPAHVGRMVAAPLGLTGGLVVPLTLASVAGALLLRTSADLVIALGALQVYVGLTIMATILETVFRAHRRLAVVVSANVGEKLILLGLAAAAVVLDAGIAGISAAYVAAGVLRFAFVLVALRSAGLARLVRPSVSEATGTLRASLPFALGLAAPRAIMRLDIVLIGLLSVTVAGYYAVAERILSVLLIIPSASATMLYPLLARERDPLRATWRAAALLGGLGAVLAAIGIVLAPTVVPLLFGSDYQDAVIGVQIELLAVPPLFAASPIMVGMFLEARERTVAVVMWACVLLGTVLVVAGQARFGLVGATLGFVLRYVALLIVLVALSVAVRRRARGGDGRDEGSDDDRRAPVGSPPDPAPEVTLPREGPR